MKRFAGFFEVLKAAFRVRFQPTTLSANQTLTLADKSGTIAAMENIGSTSTTIKLDGITTYPTLTITGAITFTAASNPVAGGTAIVRLVANGSNVPNFGPFKRAADSRVYVNSNGVTNVIYFLYDGVDYWYRVWQENTNSVTVDGAVTTADVRSVPLTGLSVSSNSAVTATDTLLAAAGKLQAQINALNPSGFFRATAPNTGAHQSLTANVFNKITLTNEVSDTTNQYNSTLSRLVASGAETWEIGAYISVNFTANTRVLLTIYKNGVELSGARLLDIGATTATSTTGLLVVCPNITLVASDYLELYILVTASGCSVFAGANESYWFGKRTA